MSARYLRVAKTSRSEEYKRLGAFIVTTLAFDTAPHHQSINPRMVDIREESYGTDGPARQHISNMESSTAGLQLGDSRCSSRGSSSACPARSNEPVNLGHSTLAPVATSRPRPPANPTIQSLSTNGILNNFRKAALRPSPVSHFAFDGDPAPQKFVKVDIPSFLHPANQVEHPRCRAVRTVAALHRANKPKQAIATMRAQFSSEVEFERHLFSHLRYKMFRLGTQDSMRKNLVARDPLLHRYSVGLQQWCASVFDATTRRVKFAIKSASCLSWQDPITHEVKLYPEVETKFSDIKEEILEARYWLQDYLEGESKLRKAVEKIKKDFSGKDLQDWRDYKNKNALTLRTVKTRKLEQPFRAMVYLSKNTHFMSWFLRNATPAYFLYKRRHIVKAIRAIEGKDSTLADVLKNLCVLDLAEFEDSRNMLEREKFHKYVRVPLPCGTMRRQLIAAPLLTGL